MGNYNQFFKKGKSTEDSNSSRMNVWDVPRSREPWLSEALAEGI